MVILLVQCMYWEVWKRYSFAIDGLYSGHCIVLISARFFLTQTQLYMQVQYGLVYV